MNDWINDLEYVLMPARHPVKSTEAKYQKAYNTWRSAWEKYRAELGVKEPLNSDAFLIPDEMGVLFYKGECVGLSSFTYGTLESGPMPDLAWFSGWTEEAYQKLRSLSTNAMIGSNFTVDPKFTGKNQIVRWKEIIFLYTFMRFEASIADVMAGHLNLLRKVEEACGENNGATVLDPSHYFVYAGINVPAQIVAYEKHNIKKMKEKHLHLCDGLWSRLNHVSEFPVLAPVLRFKKAA